MGALDHQPLVVPLEALDRSSLALAGGKAANLGELMKAGFDVPPGFCVTTAAYREAAGLARLDSLLASLGSSNELAPAARSALLGISLSEAVIASVRAAYTDLRQASQEVPLAVRSSATAEDLPDASFAGQQDTYLDIVGQAALLDAVRRCWASLWTDRAVAYREANGIDHRTVLLAVVVQRMVAAATAGVLFTANPLTGRRREAVIDAVPGLGDALVSGAANPDHFIVDTWSTRITARQLASSTTDDRPPTHEAGRSSVVDGRSSACLTDLQVLELAGVGKAVESHFGAPQDIEWAHDHQGALWLLQARPITTLFPLPGGTAPEEADLLVYGSINVVQGVLGPLTPMGAAALRRAIGAGGRLAGFTVEPTRGPSAVVEAGGRLFVNMTPLLRHPLGRRFILGLLGIAEAQTARAIRGLLNDTRLALLPKRVSLRVVRRLVRLLVAIGLPSGLIGGLTRPAATRHSRLRAARRLMRLQGAPASPPGALGRVEQLLDRLPLVMTRLLPLAIVGMASFALARRIAASVGAADEALLVLRALPHNPTTEMDLALWSLASRLRSDTPSAALLSRLPAAELAARFRDGALPATAQSEVADFLRRYGFRGVAEIDVGVPRWRDDPTPLFRVLANYLLLDDPQRAPDAQFRLGAAQAEAASVSIMRRARTGGLRGWLRVALLRLLFDRARQLAGVREAPKFLAVQVLSECRELLNGVGAWLAERGRLERADDVFFLDLSEARCALSGRDYRSTVSTRRERHARDHRRPAPRVLLSDGTTLYGAEAAAGERAELAGTPASPGVYRGRARVILDARDAHLEPGEVLVAPSTDPGWTPLFLTAGALVMEMGGMMSHGAVVAREYGIPAVVGLLGATTALETGRDVVVDGSRGRVALAEGVSATT